MSHHNFFSGGAGFFPQLSHPAFLLHKMQGFKMTWAQGLEGKRLGWALPAQAFSPINNHARVIPSGKSNIGPQGEMTEEKDL